ncbi:MAG: DUF4331 family protein [Chitinophagales bacterium]
MKNILNNTSKKLSTMLIAGAMAFTAMASSHREAPMISGDPLADNTDLYAFRSPDDPNTITIIANYIPLQLPHGGPNYASFGENIRYEIHIDNDINTTGDDIIYRFTFSQMNEDPTTFFNIRLGAQNLKTTYTLQKSIDGGASFTTIITDGIVPPNNIGDRSISDPVVGLGTTYAELIAGAIATTDGGEMVYAGPADDPFFVDLGGIFDLGDAPRADGMPHDGVACLNVHSIALKIPISLLQKDGLSADDAENILDGNFVIGVWASASRPAMRTLNTDGTVSDSGEWIQVSRLGMPLTNEAVIPIGEKDYWNSLSPYAEDASHSEYFYNPELALYMDDDLFGGAVPGFSALRIQTASLGAYDFSNGADGLYGLKGSAAVAGTALDDAIFGTLLLPAAGKPRSVDLWPLFLTGAPNLAPYQLATGKLDGNPLADGKPFINNFLPNGGDMLRLNMAVPPTDRNDPAFSSLGLIQAAVLGLTDPIYTATADLEFIPNMDGFPNGRRLEDDVTRIELQAVSGVVLAAIGLWYDDYIPGTSPSPVTTDLLNVLGYTTGVESNDTSFKAEFPYVQTPWSGTGKCSGVVVDYFATAGDCSAPTDLVATSITDNSAVLSWTLNGSLAYDIKYAAVGSGMFTTVTTTEGSLTISDLMPCTAYRFKVSAICATTGKVVSAIYSFTTTGEGCGRIANNESFAEVFPNPAKDVLQITYAMQGASTARVLDITGKVFLQQSFAAYDGIQTVNLNVQSLPSGMYFLEMNNSTNQIINKIVIAK